MERSCVAALDLDRRSDVLLQSERIYQFVSESCKLGIAYVMLQGVAVHEMGTSLVK